MRMSNLFPVDPVARIVMVSSAEPSPFRMHHHTVVPSNLRPEGDEEESDDS